MGCLIAFLLLGVVGALIAGTFRPTPRPQIIYVPVEAAESQGSGMGCLPLIVAALFLLVVLSLLRF